MNFIPLPVTHPVPLIRPNEGNVNHDPHDVPVVATHLVDVGASRTSTSSNPLTTLMTPPSLLTSARRPNACAAECGRSFLMPIFVTPIGSRSLGRGPRFMPP